MEAIQDMIETMKSRIQHLGNWGPSAAPASLAASLELSTAGTAGAGAGEGEKNLKAIIYLTFVFCTNLALKRAQLSLCLSTSASNVKKNITVF